MSNDTEAATVPDALTGEQGEAADSLVRALDDLRETRLRMRHYDYEYPQYLLDDRNRARLEIRDAVRDLLR